MDVKEGHDFEIPCKASGVPKPKITWSYNGKVLGHRDDVMALPKIKKADTGYYGCKAENEHGLIYEEVLVNVV